MANEIAPIKRISNLMNGDAVKSKFTEMLGKKAPQFISSVMTVVNGNSDLSIAEPNTVYGSALVAASLDLPVNTSLGYCAIIAYKDNKNHTCKAQFQIMTKGYVELAMRSGQMQNIINEVVYEGQLVKKNKFTGEYIFDEDAKKSDKIIGYMAYFRMINGFEKTLYMSVDEVKAHANRFSMTYRKGFGVWKDNFDAMALKTVLKQLISKYAPKSTEMQQAIQFDGASVKADETTNDIQEAEIVYEDNSAPAPTNEERVIISEEQKKIDDFMAEHP